MWISLTIWVVYKLVFIHILYLTDDFIFAYDISYDMWGGMAFCKCIFLGHSPVT